MQTLSTNELVAAIDNCLPQTHCQLCDYANCWEYAKAVAHNQTDINKCPPGGEVTLRHIAKLLNRDKILPDRPANFSPTAPPKVAKIDEQHCIGCVRCIHICPVDCIIGSAKLMHTVLADGCSGCELCLSVCPTDCIDMIERSTSNSPKLDATQNHDLSLWPPFSQPQISQFRRRAWHKRRRKNDAEKLKSERINTMNNETYKNQQRRTEILESVARTADKKWQLQQP